LYVLDIIRLRNLNLERLKFRRSEFSRRCAAAAPAAGAALEDALPPAV
jgi:hypothetical protein